MPLDYWRGTVELLAEELGEPGPETLVLQWLETLCSWLDVLHAQGWVHGDVSKSNIPVDEHRVILIDYASPDRLIDRELSRNGALRITGTPGGRSRIAAQRPLGPGVQPLPHYH